MELEQEVEEVMSKAKVYEKDAVVKCGSCEHWNNETGNCLMHDFNYPVPSDWFCADASISEEHE